MAAEAEMKLSRMRQSFQRSRNTIWRNEDDKEHRLGGSRNTAVATESPVEAAASLFGSALLADDLK
eukprot:6489743-Amphidinium_carterae.1